MNATPLNNWTQQKMKHVLLNDNHTGTCTHILISIKFSWIIYERGENWTFYHRRLCCCYSGSNVWRKKIHVLAFTHIIIVFFFSPTSLREYSGAMTEESSICHNNLHRKRERSHSALIIWWLMVRRFFFFLWNINKKKVRKRIKV